MKNRMLFGGFVAIATLMLTMSVNAEVFEITIENLSNNVLSPTAFISHDDSVDLFDVGSAASTEVESIAEDGNTAPLVTLATGLLGSGVADVQVALGPGSPPVIMNGETATVMLEADMDNPWLSFLSMIGISNDGFIGVTTGDGAINLFPDGVPLVAEFTISFIDVWDAGTEVNDELATSVIGLGADPGAGDVEGGVITRPHPGVAGIGDIPEEVEWYGYDVARIIIIPEPASYALFAIGAAALLRRNRN